MSRIPTRSAFIAVVGAALLAVLALTALAWPRRVPKPPGLP
jgi:hypothetical protein